MSGKDVLVRTLVPFQDRKEGVFRNVIRPNFLTTEKRAKALVDKGLVEIVRVIEQENTQDNSQPTTKKDQNTKSLNPTPDDKSLSGPPEDKTSVNFNEMTVDDLRTLADKRGISLPSGYVAKDDLIKFLTESD